MLQRDEDRHHIGFLVRLVDVHTVLVVEGEHLLADDGDDAAIGVIELKIQPRDVAAQLPAKALDVGDVLDDVPQLVGKLKLRAVGHVDEVPLMDGEKLFPHIGHQAALGVKDLRPVMEAEGL